MARHPKPTTMARGGKTAWHSSIVRQPRSTCCWTSCPDERTGRCGQRRRKGARALLDRQNHPDDPATDDELQRATIEEDLSDPTRLVLRAMRIQYPLEQQNPKFQADAAFLMRARDVLNTRASPATGATIAFTSLLAAGLPADQRSAQLSDFAERAYPQFRTPASALASSVTWTLRGLIVVLVAALLVSGYTAWGKVMLDTLDAIRRDDGATQQELAAARSEFAAWQPAMTCGQQCPDAKASTIVAFQAISICDARAAGALPVCDRQHDIEIRRAVTTYELAMWEFPSWFPWLDKANAGQQHPR